MRAECHHHVSIPTLTDRTPHDVLDVVHEREVPEHVNTCFN